MQATPPPADTSRVSQPSGQLLAIVIAVYLLTWWFVFAGAIGGNLTIYQLGLFALCGEGLYFLATSSAGRSLRAWWRARSRGQKVGTGCLLIAFPLWLLVLPFWPAGTLFQGLRQYYQALQQRPGQHLRATWQRLQGRPRSFQAGVGAALLVGITLLALATGVVMANPNAGFLGSGSTSDTTPPATNGNGNGNVALATQQHVELAATSTPAPTATATATPVPTATSVPTATPIPLICTDAGCNPWGYNFSHGSAINNPPGDFCTYFHCIQSFWNQTNGYVEECRDATFSHSGGRSGSCSYHQGDWRPLLQP
jgi:hypothetical protein